MPIPDYQSLMLPVLSAASDHNEHSIAELRMAIASKLNLSDDELAQRLASDSQTVFGSRVAWAVQYLKQAGILNAVRRGTYQITSRGQSLLNGKPTEINIKTLRQFPEFADFEQRGNDSQQLSTSVAAVSNDATSTPEELLEKSFQTLREALANDLLESIRTGTPAAFEQIVVDLLVAMGYGGSVKDAGKVVGKSGDGGIDGIIKQDKLGLDAIYIQAKRWKEVVGSPEIMKFSGSLTKKHANRGVFITTSTFTKDAMEFVEAMPQRIILIDGKYLTSLMIEHDVGVSPTRTFTLKRLDQDYFENL